MKKEIEIADAILAEAQKVIEKEKQTLDALVNEGLAANTSQVSSRRQDRR
jgi:uncharacterized coiled-coil protein SlyX